MVVEANRDAAKECVLKAKEAMLAKNFEKMRRLLQKAKNLDPNCNVEHILKNGYVSADDTPSRSTRSDDTNDHHYSHDDHYEDSRPESPKAAGPRHRPTRRPSSTSTNAHARSRSRSLKTDQNVQKEYTNEEEAFIARIRHCKDYYEILEVTKTEFNEAMLKKKYRELALRLHPDKCKAPGATEAFKALGNAYAVLSDCKKREEYDRYGAEDTRNIRRNNSSEFYEYDINRGFEADISPEDIFEMFFGGGYSTRSYNRRRTQFRFHREEPNVQEASPLLQLLQILPILLIVLGGILIQFLSSAPPYSLNPDSTYVSLRYTRDLKVPYYVKSDFEENYGKRIQQVEHHVENDYVTMLRTHCYREKTQRDGLLWTARMRGDSDLWKRAQEMEMAYCKKLEELYR